MNKPSGSIRTYFGTLALVITALKQSGVDIPITPEEIDKIVLDWSQLISGAVFAYGLGVNWFKRLRIAVEKLVALIDRIIRYLHLCLWR